MRKNTAVGFTHSEYKEAISEAQTVANKMNALRRKKAKKLTTIVLSDGTIVSSTSRERLQEYKELENRTLRIGY